MRRPFSARHNSSRSSDSDSSISTNLVGTLTIALSRLSRHANRLVANPFRTDKAEAVTGILLESQTSLSVQIPLQIWFSGSLPQQGLIIRSSFHLPSIQTHMISASAALDKLAQIILWERCLSLQGFACIVLRPRLRHPCLCHHVHWVLCPMFPPLPFPRHVSLQMLPLWNWFPKKKSKWAKQCEIESFSWRQECSAILMRRSSIVDTITWQWHAGYTVWAVSVTDAAHLWDINREQWVANVASYNAASNASMHSFDVFVRLFVILYSTPSEVVYDFLTSVYLFIALS